MKEKNEIEIKTGKVLLRGNLEVPEKAIGFVIFSHGSGSSRFSVRNRQVAAYLNQERIATLLTDLLTEEEDRVYQNRFNIDLITERLIAVTENVLQRPELKDLETGYFGASTGAASAIRAAAKLDRKISAVVSRGGRPDLATSALLDLKAPTLLIVGSLDVDVLMLNEQAMGMMFCDKKLEVVEGASHLFEEPGKLEEVSKLATSWFIRHLHPSNHLVS